MAQFDAGSIEATLILNEDPFIAGLRDAQRRAEAFERDPIVKKVEISVDQKMSEETRRFLNTIGEDIPVIIEPTVDRTAHAESHFAVNALGEAVHVPVSPEVIAADIARAKAVLDALRSELRAKPLDLNLNITGLTFAGATLSAFRRAQSRPITVPVVPVVTPAVGAAARPGILRQILGVGASAGRDISRFAVGVPLTTTLFGAGAGGVTGGQGGAFGGLASFLRGGATPAWGAGIPIIGGMASAMGHFGSLAALAGISMEHLLITSTAVLATFGGGLLGGALAGLGMLTTAAVGMGTDLAGIGQASGDIRMVTADMTALSQANAVYGKNSLQAAHAQAQLTADLKSFSPVARGAVLAAANQIQTFKRIFDQVTGPAEKTGAQIINQLVKVGEGFLPTIGRFAAQNMKIIQTALQPLLKWISGPGLAIFTQLEQHFQKQLPTSMSIFTNGIEVLIKALDFLATHTGGVLNTLNKWVKWLNTPQGTSWFETKLQHLLDMFHQVAGLVKVAIEDLALLFRADPHTGRGIIAWMTSELQKLHTYLKSPAGFKAIHDFLVAHKAEVLALLGLIPQLAAGFVKFELAVGPTLTRALTTVIGLLKTLLDLPFGKLLIAAGTLAFFAKQMGAFTLAAAGLKLLRGEGAIGGLLFPGKAAATAAAARGAAGTAATGIAGNLGVADVAVARVSGRLMAARFAAALGAGITAFLAGYSFGTYLYKDTAVGKWARHVVGYITGVNQDMAAINAASAVPDISPPAKGPLAIRGPHGQIQASGLNAWQKAMQTQIKDLQKSSGLSDSAQRSVLEDIYALRYEMRHPTQYAKIRKAIDPALGYLQGAPPLIPAYKSEFQRLWNAAVFSLGAPGGLPREKPLLSRAGLQYQLGKLTNNPMFQSYRSNLALWHSMYGFGPAAEPTAIAAGGGTIPTYSASILRAIARDRRLLGLKGQLPGPDLSATRGGMDPFSWLWNEINKGRGPAWGGTASAAENTKRDAAAKRMYDALVAHDKRIGKTPPTGQEWAANYLRTHPGIAGLPHIHGVPGAVTAGVKGAPSYAAMGKAMVAGVAHGVSSNWHLVTSALTTHMKTPPNIGKNWLTPAGHDAVRGFTKGLTTGWSSNVVPWLQSIKSKVSSHVHGAGQWLTPVAHHVIEGFHKGLTTGWTSSVVPWLTSIKSKVTQHFTAGGAGQWLTPVGHHVIEGFHRGLATGWTSSVVPWLDSVKSKVTQHFTTGGAGQWLTPAGHNVIHGFYTGVTASWSANVVPWLTSVPTKVKGYFASASGWLTAAGTAIVTGLYNGLESGVSLIQSWASQVISIIQGVANQVSNLSAQINAAATNASNQAASIGQSAAAAKASAQSISASNASARQVPAVHINTAHFNNQANLKTLMNQADFLLQSGRTAG
jgi:hypothetical protein